VVFLRGKILKDLEVLSRVEELELVVLFFQALLVLGMLGIELTK